MPQIPLIRADGTVYATASATRNRLGRRSILEIARAWVSGVRITAGFVGGARARTALDEMRGLDDTEQRLAPALGQLLPTHGHAVDDIYRGDQCFCDVAAWELLLRLPLRLTADQKEKWT